MFEIITERTQEGTAVSQPVAGETRLNDKDFDETLLNVQIAELWQTHETYRSILRQESRTFRGLRDELGERLAEMKKMLARPGRAGEWCSWLRQRHIPRATADRLIKKHEQKLHPENNCLNDAIVEPTQEDIEKLLNSMLPKLRKILRTPSSKNCFMELLVKSFADMEDSEIMQSSESHSLLPKLR
jgi:hypothetical protein